MADVRELRDNYVIGVAAYSGASLLSALSGVILIGPDKDFETIGLVAIGVAAFGLIPFLVTKLIMGRLGWDSLIAHVLCGGIAANLAPYLFFGSWHLPTLQGLAFFTSLGAGAGLFYWSCRAVGQKLMYRTAQN